MFDRIPDNLFSVLASKNKRIYYDALMVVREAFKMHLTILRTDLISMLINSMEDEILKMEEAEEETDLISKANFIIRKFDNVGWIKIDFQGNTFENIISVPDYSMTLINVLYDLSKEETREYNSLVVSTYNNLKMADQTRDEFMYTAFEGAYRDTENLLDSLKSLFNNIGRYHQKLLDITKINEILISHFDDYQESIMSKYYHPLKTFDSVPRFKGPILLIISKWYKDEHIKNKLVEQALNYNVYENSESAYAGIHSKLNFIADTYEVVSGIIDEIDKKNSIYTQVTIEKIQYLLNRDQSIKGKLISIMKTLPMKEFDEEEIRPFLNIYQQSYVDQSSLYSRTKMRMIEMKSPLKVSEMSDSRKEVIATAFTSAIERAYSNERIKEYIMHLVESGPVSSADMPLEIIRDLMKMMLGAIQSGRKDVPFEVVFYEEYYENYGYIVPLMTFRKKVNYVD
ncbi:MAG: DUF5716 family protein [Bacillota bacterium]|nr:DUF5716 family protein [Bacillota bacterium]